MKRARRVAVLALGLVLVLASLAPVGAQGTLVKLRIAFPSVPDFADVPVMLAAERLRSKGIDLEAIFFAQDPLVLQAVLRGDADIGAGASRAVLAAMLEGAKLKFFLTQNRNIWTLVARRDITNCTDLSGKRLAIHSEGGISTAFVRGWLKEKCPTSTPNILVIPGSENRAAALVAGQIDVTPLELSDAIQVERVAGTRFYRLADFSKDMPWLLDSLFYSSPRTIGAKRELLKTFTRELITLHRLAAKDPSIMATVAPKYVKGLDTSLFPQISKAFSDATLWPTDGGFTPAAVARTNQFFVDIQSIKAGLKAEEIGDYTIVRDALDELGR